MSTSPQHPRPAVRVLAMLVGVGLALLCLEAGLRAADVLGLVSLWEERRTALEDSIWVGTDEPGLVYRHRPDYRRDGVRYTERAGILRPQDVPEQAAPWTFRIAVLGDSVAAAVDIAYAQRAATLLEARLNEQSARQRIEVLNFGVNGYSTRQEAIQLETLVARYRPDLLVVQYCMNDFYPSERPLGWFLEHPSLYTLDYLAGLVERYTAPGYPPVQYWEDLYREDVSGMDNVRDGFAAISAYAARNEVPVLLVIFPLISHEGWMAGNAAARHAQVAALGAQADFNVLDLLPVFARHDIESMRFRPWDTFHPNEAGQRVAAAAMADWLARRVLPQ